LGHLKFDLGVRDIGFKNRRRRQPEIGYIFGSQLTTNVILVAKETFLDKEIEYYENTQEAYGSCC